MIWVTCITYMTLSKRLVAASANRMISFYDISNKNLSPTPTSRIEGLVGIPLCMDYHRYVGNYDGKREVLLMGDDLGICHLYNFTQDDWHTCEYKQGTSDPNTCHKAKIEEDYEKEIKEAFKKPSEKKKDITPGDINDLKAKNAPKKPFGYKKVEKGI